MRNIAVVQLNDAYVECRSYAYDDCAIVLEANVDDGRGFAIELSVDRREDRRIQLSACFEDMDDADVKARFLIRMTEEQTKQLIAALSGSALRETKDN